MPDLWAYSVEFEADYSLVIDKIFAGKIEVPTKVFVRAGGVPERIATRVECPVKVFMRNGGVPERIETSGDAPTKIRARGEMI